MNNYSLKMNITKNTQKIIEFLMRNSYKTGFNVNQIARELKISVGSSHKILKELKLKEMIKSLDLRNSIYYSLNLNNLDVIDLCKIILRENKKNLNAISKVYVEEIEKFDAELIILFGSILTKKEFNDVDVLFITDNVKEVNKFSNEVSRLRTKSINPLIMTFKDFVKNIKLKEKVILEILNKGIVLKGEGKFLEALKNAS